MPLQELINGAPNGQSLDSADDVDARLEPGPPIINDNAPPSTSTSPRTSSKTLGHVGDSRTVPDHQPGTPHADLHHPPEQSSNWVAPLDDRELQEAIQVKVKMEDGLDDGGVDSAAGPDAGLAPEQKVERLVKGQAVDDEEMVHELKPRERPAQLEERLHIIRFVPVTSSIPSITTSIILTGLKNIFQRQLPKMPREYITRLVFDRNHWSVAIVKKGYQVVGGITYRPFENREFGEIVFCAITGTEQVRGYGSHLMNHVKDWVRSAHPGIKHFLTYADNYAFGYFKKQGFTKDVTLPRSYWAGYIKDYEGATIMQCTMLPRIQYLEAGMVLLKQKMEILKKIRENSNSHIVHSGSELFGSREKIDPSEVQALREIGWDPSIDALTRQPERGPQHAIMRRLLTDMQNHPASWAFARPVNADEVTDYYTTIKQPMDLETMENKLNHNKYFLPPKPDPDTGEETQTTKELIALFLKDCKLIFDNCRSYNSPSSNYFKNANKLERFLEERVRAYTEQD